MESVCFLLFFLLIKNHYFQYINVIGNGQKIVEVAAEPTGVINEETLRRAFLLEADVVIGLFRNGRALRLVFNNNIVSLIIFLNLNKKFRYADSFFYLQDNWVGAEFELIWEEARRSRPATPIDQSIVFK